MQFTALTLAALASSALAAPTLMSRASGWTIQTFTRDCTDPTICTYYFNINENNGTAAQHCTITDVGSPATTHSWYAKACDETTKYGISWGWDPKSTFTVMTVVDETTQLEAFFGYNYPNAANSYPDNGPNAAQPV